MITHDPIGALSYFARKINFAAGTEGALLEEGEGIKIIGAREGVADATEDLVGNPNWPAVLLRLKLKREQLSAVKCASSELTLRTLLMT
jgi:hypothetical protein